jgi:hypothetical protein
MLSRLWLHAGPGLHTLAFWDSDAIAPGFWQSLARLMHTLPELSCVQFRQVCAREML